MVKFKKGVRIFGARPEIAVALPCIAAVFERYGYECVVTSVTDGKHSRASLHYAGQALDLRKYHIRDDQHEAIAQELRAALTDEFDVVVEDTHFHIEYQPKTGLNAG